MLSLIDLLDAGSVDLPLAAYLAAAMRAGASLLVGATPGGAGKTAVMCALLNFVPNQTELIPVAGQTVLAQALRDSLPGQRCYVAHEIGPGHYFAYLWGGQARAFFALAAHGHQIAANLHADTLDETYDQLVRQNGVEQAQVQAVTLKIYLQMAWEGRTARRWVYRVYENVGQDRLVWEGRAVGQFVRVAPSLLVSEAVQAQYAGLLNDLHRRNVRRIEEVRLALVSCSF